MTRLYRKPLNTFNSSCLCGHENPHTSVTLHPLSALLTGALPPRAATWSLQFQLECCLDDSISPDLQSIGQATPISLQSFNLQMWGAII